MCSENHKIKKNLNLFLMNVGVVCVLVDDSKIKSNKYIHHVHNVSRNKKKTQQMVMKLLLQ